MKRFLVTGCPRSGTGYAAALFRALGVRCGHEDVFGVGQALGRKPVDWNGYGGDSSWLAVPALPLDDVVVLHQVRHPLEVVRSIVGVGFLADPSRIGRGQRRFAAVVRLHNSEVFTPDVDAERAALMWRIWNTRAEEHATFTYRLEDLDVGLLLSLAHLVELELSSDQAVQALDRIPSSVNRRRRDDSIAWDSIAPMLGDLADRYDYCA
jgi:hypothetical protein